MGEAIQIADFDTKSKRPVLNLLAMKKIINSKGTQDLPTLIVSIGGVARSGKSFLLNLMVNYLQYVEKRGTHVGWEMSNERVQGINWAQSRKAVTRGVWMWNTPYKVKRRDGSEVAVLLVDSQGTGDNRMSDPKLDTLIMYISLELSTYQLLNIQSYLTSNELTSLQLCTDYADLGPAADGETRAHDHLFDCLMFIVRNYQSDDRPHGEDPNLFNEILEEGTNDDLLRSVRGIKRAFKKITSYTLPYPGQTIAGASENKKEWRLSDIPADFLKPTKDLCVDLFSSSTKSVREIQTGVQHLQRFEVLKFRLESTDLPDIGTPADALQETILYRAFTMALDTYTKQLAKLKAELLKHESEDDVRTAYSNVTNVALAMFTKEGHHKKYGATVIWRKYQEHLEKRFDVDLESTIIIYVREKKIAALAEENRMIQERFETAQKESAQKMGRLEKETLETATRLKETQRQSEMRETANREQLDKITTEMKNAREEDRAWYEREADRYRASIEQEKDARDRAEQLHSDRVQDINNTLERMTRDHEERERKTAEQMQTLQRELERERNRPPPQPQGGGGSCTIL